MLVIGQEKKECSRLLQRLQKQIVITTKLRCVLTISGIKESFIQDHFHLMKPTTVRMYVAS